MFNIYIISYVTSELVSHGKQIQDKKKKYLGSIYTQRRSSKTFLKKQDKLFLHTSGTKIKVVLPGFDPKEKPHSFHIKSFNLSPSYSFIHLIDCKKALSAIIEELSPCYKKVPPLNSCICFRYNGGGLSSTYLPSTPLSG